MILRIKILQVTSLARIACSVILYIEEVFFFFLRGECIEDAAA